MLVLYITTLGECDLVNNGSEAIKAFIKAIDKGENYDLITLDIVMPEMDGHEVLKRIRKIIIQISMIKVLDFLMNFLMSFLRAMHFLLQLPFLKR